MTTQLAIADDIIVPFALEGAGVRGQVARLGPSVTKILDAHDYPETVAMVLGEAVLLAAMLGAALKFDGRFILQASSDGPVSLLVADFTAPDAMRAYARFDAAAVGTAASAADLLGKGHVTLSVDQGPDTEMYQGIVPLEGGTLAQAALVYFRQSEQIPTRLHLAAGILTAPTAQGAKHSWRAGGIMIQDLPTAGAKPASVDSDAWDRVSALMETVNHDEILDPTLAHEDLLFRLFHQEGVRVFEPKNVRAHCQCSEKRVRTMLASFGEVERADMVKDGLITVTCEFCNKGYRFTPEYLAG
ncbi:MAG: Hsp33 family molecular chaperone [Alphaproteobacteria bacterium]